MITCMTCGHRREAREIDLNGRCNQCASQFAMRKMYANRVIKARSRAMEARAGRTNEMKRNSKHCPNCHRMRYKDEYLQFHNAFSTCAICRDEAVNEVKKKERFKRTLAQVTKQNDERTAAVREQQEKEMWSWDD